MKKLLYKKNRKYKKWIKKLKQNLKYRGITIIKSMIKYKS